MNIKKLLKEDILERYNNPEYWDPDISEEYLREDILERYNNLEYWDPDIVENYINSNKYLTPDEYDVILRILPNCKQHLSRMLEIKKDDYENNIKKL